VTDSKFWCPLNCGWFLSGWLSDASAIDLSGPKVPAFPLPASPAGVDHFAFSALTLELQRAEASIRSHLESHALSEWVEALAGLRRERDVARVDRNQLAEAVRCGLAAAASILEAS
jgi:hypothetical protein